MGHFETKQKNKQWQRDEETESGIEEDSTTGMRKTKKTKRRSPMTMPTERRRRERACVKAMRMVACGKRKAGRDGGKHGKDDHSRGETTKTNKHERKRKRKNKENTRERKKAKQDKRGVIK